MNQRVHSEEECDGDIRDSSSDYYYLDDNLCNSPSRLAGDDSTLGHSTLLRLTGLSGISSGLSAGQSDYITQQSVGIPDSEPLNLSEILNGDPILTQSLAGAGMVCDWAEDPGESSSNKRDRSEEEVGTFNNKHKHTQMSSQFSSASDASIVSPSYTHCGFRDTEYWQGISTQTPPIQSSNLNVNKNPTRIFVPESPDHNDIFLI